MARLCCCFSVWSKRASRRYTAVSALSQCTALISARTKARKTVMSGRSGPVVWFLPRGPNSRVPTPPVAVEVRVDALDHVLELEERGHEY